ncbi:MAG TPA: substrate-binding domain-containing protein [Pseudobacteroides sp.]|uniref:substrate-binding domain-containing protein n=1 Tax=Pseudobacteroides sp. TaxID=1968840 RepID=UPI002F956BB8
MSRRINIGVITRLAEGSYHGALVNAINNVIQNSNANLVIINTFMLTRFCSVRGEDPGYYYLASSHVDGWIVLEGSASNGYIDVIRRTGKPLVLVSFQPDNYEDCCVIQEDSRYGAEIITKHLIEHGHKKIAFLGCSNLYDMVERFKGYKSALEKSGLNFDPNLVIDSSIAHTPYGKNAMLEKLKEGYEFTGLFAANDFMAFGAIEALREFGLRVPEDVAVIGYDDCFHARKFSPSLSSMHQNLDRIGTLAVETVIKAITKGTLPKETLFVRSSLILRKSCGCSVNSDDIEYPNESTLELKNKIIQSLEESVGNNYIMASELIPADIDKLEKIMPHVASNFQFQCIGYWVESPEGHKDLLIQHIVGENSEIILNKKINCVPENFPPNEFLSLINNPSSHVIWLLPISTLTKDWCIISYIAPFNYISTLLAYGSSVTMYNLIGIFLDREMANTELKSTLEKLKETLETLRKTQGQLVHSEKMASLGGLVAGVAHEINTPIGVSVTAASFIQEHSDKLKEQFISGKLKRHDMENFFKILDETNSILVSNLKKASNLIDSFKQIAVDQSTEVKRWFKAGIYIKQILISLRSRLIDNNLEIKFECKNEFEIYNYPGGLFKVITNLVDNSIMHAYNKGDKGTILIRLLKENDILNIIYSDDGKGMEKSVLDKIFDPFYTTKRGEGGTGLGLNIVYNIVTGEYGGTIECKSEPGKGCMFIIRIPSGVE